jgi:hypothetical protein
MEKKGAEKRGQILFLGTPIKGFCPSPPVPFFSHYPDWMEA